MSPLLILALGCGTADDPGTAPGPGEVVLTDPEAPFLSEETTEEVDVDLAGIEASVEEAIRFVIDLDPDPLVTAYRNAMTAAEPGCPAFFEDDGFVFWLDTCTASNGTRFDGLGIDDVQTGLDLGDGMITDLITVGGTGVIEGPSGTMDANGFAQIVTQVDPLGTIAVEQLFLSGEFWTDDPVADGTWLADGIVPNVLVLTYDLPGLGNLAIVSGVLENLPSAYPTVVFDEAVIGTTSIGVTDCELEPSGSVSVQLENGDWVDILFDPEFDGEVVTTPDMSTCDGCGRAWHQTRELGEACFDFGPWVP